jgi:hypothetical protein
VLVTSEVPLPAAGKAVVAILSGSFEVE